MASFPCHGPTTMQNMAPNSLLQPCFNATVESCVGMYGRGVQTCMNDVFRPEYAKCRVVHG
jgi:hypothetical protein